MNDLTSFIKIFPLFIFYKMSYLKESTKQIKKQPKFELTPENLKELKQIKPRTEDEQITEYLNDLHKVIETIETFKKISDYTNIKKIKINSLKYYKYDLDKGIKDLSEKNILITKKELFKYLELIN